MEKIVADVKADKLTTLKTFLNLRHYFFFGLSFLKSIDRAFHVKNMMICVLLRLQNQTQAPLSAPGTKSLLKKCFIISGTTVIPRNLRPNSSVVCACMCVCVWLRPHVGMGVPCLKWLERLSVVRSRPRGDSLAGVCTSNQIKPFSQSPSQAAASEAGRFCHLSCLLAVTARN